LFRVIVASQPRRCRQAAPSKVVEILVGKDFLLQVGDVLLGGRRRQSGVSGA
jgi:hypothetical protein